MLPGDTLLSGALAVDALPAGIVPTDLSLYAMLALILLFFFFLFLMIRRTVTAFNEGAKGRK